MRLIAELTGLRDQARKGCRCGASRRIFGDAEHRRKHPRAKGVRRIGGGRSEEKYRCVERRKIRRIGGRARDRVQILQRHENERIAGRPGARAKAAAADVCGFKSERSRQHLGRRSGPNLLWQPCQCEPRRSSSLGRNDAAAHRPYRLL